VYDGSLSGCLWGSSFFPLYTSTLLLDRVSQKRGTLLIGGDDLPCHIVACDSQKTANVLIAPYQRSSEYAAYKILKFISSSINNKTYLLLSDSNVCKLNKIMMKHT